MTDTTRVVATGTFDVLHPGHVHYLREATRHGDELHVVVANDATVSHKERPVVPNEQRREMVAALDPVDEAHLGDPEDFSRPIRRVDPDVLVLGGDQHHDETDVEAMLDAWGVECAVRRASMRDADDGEVLASSEIRRRIRSRDDRIPVEREV